MFAEMVDIDKHMGGEALNAKSSTLPGTFLWLSILSLSLSVECVYVHADTPVGYVTGLDLSPLTYVWSFCKHVSTGKHSTCMHNTHACFFCVCVQFIHFFLVYLGIMIHLIITHLHLK